MDYFECLLANLHEIDRRICIVGDFNMSNIKWEYSLDSSNSADSADGIKFCSLSNSHFLSKLFVSLLESHTPVSLLWIWFFVIILKKYLMLVPMRTSALSPLRPFSPVNKSQALEEIKSIRFDLKKADLSGLKSALRHLSWDTVFVDNDIDACTACWYDMLLSCVDEFVPKVVIKLGREAVVRHEVRE